MNTSLLLAATACTAALAGLAFAQDNPESRAPLSAESSWSLDAADCSIGTTWDDKMSLYVSQHGDHRDISLYNTGFQGVKNDAMVVVSFGTDGQAALPQTYPARGIRDEVTRGYVVTGDDALLARLASSKSFQFYRGGKQLVTLDMTDLREGLDAMDTCLASLPPETNAMEAADGNMMMDADGMANEAMSAADAANAAMDTAEPK